LLEASVLSDANEVKSELEAAYRGNANGSLRRNVDAAVMDMIASAESYLITVKSGFVDAGSRGDATPLESVFSTAVGSTMRAWVIAQADLERLLQERITELGLNLRLSIVLTGLLVGLSILLAVMTHRHVVSSLGHLEGIVARVRDLKVSNVGSDRHEGDEFGKLTVAFKSMLAELAAAREREIADQARSARQALLTTMGQMAASIAHELNQPLAAIVTNGNAGLRWLGKATPDLDEGRAALKRVVSDGHRASQVIATIRSIFKKDGQNKAPLDVNELLREVLGLVTDQLHDQQVSIETELAAKSPEILGDRTQLQQVILNLITNAIDAMGSVTERPRVLRVRSETEEPDDVVISVEDTGVGIDSNSTDRIFDSFYTTKSHGMGIGLAICRSIIEAHGGRISAAPRTPHGSVFQVILPMHELPAV
jgi:signal transduction histidine kinase